MVTRNHIKDINNDNNNVIKINNHRNNVKIIYGGNDEL